MARKSKTHPERPTKRQKQRRGRYLQSLKDRGVVSDVWRRMTGVLAQRELWGTGTPEGAITAEVGSVYHRTDGGAGTCLYVKESGTGATGWVAK